MQDIQEVFGATTVGLGAFAVVCATYLLLNWLWCLAVGRRRFHRVTLPAINGVHASICFPVVFAFGLMVQDVSDHLTDTEFRFGSYPLGSEGWHRLRVLFADDKFQEVNALWKNMGSQSVHLERILKSTYESTEDVDLFLADLGKFVEKRCHRLAERYINAIFYEAKNWAYSQSGHFSELQSIQRRIDFARSIYLLAAVALVVALVVLAGCAVALRRNSGVGRGAVRRRSEVLRVRRGVGVAILVLFAVGGLTDYAYGRAQWYFNERAFGYYVSYWQHRRLAALEEGDRREERMQAVAGPAVAVKDPVDGGAVAP